MRIVRAKRSERNIRRAMAEIFLAERCLLSDYLYFVSAYKADYPELSEMLEAFCTEHANNVRHLNFYGTKDSSRGRETRARTNACEAISYILAKEQRLKLLYERLYLLCDEVALEGQIKEILRASGMRLSILENIQKA